VWVWIPTITKSEPMSALAPITRRAFFFIQWNLPEQPAPRGTEGRALVYRGRRVL
jgi:hypothetical protein